MFRFLTQHIRDVNESYFTHAKWALYFAFRLIYSGICVGIHAVLPFVLIVTGSNNVKSLNIIMGRRACYAKLFTTKEKRIAIIGCGPAGIMTLYNLVQNAIQNSTSRLTVTLFDKTSFPNLGLAYGNSNSAFLLNVPAGKMSAVDQNPYHLLEWLEYNGYKYTSNDFIPRYIYGLYLQDLFKKTLLKAASHNIAVEMRRMEVLDVDRYNDVFTIANELFTHLVVSTGPKFEKNDIHSKHINLSGLLSKDVINIAGTGLTAVEQAIHLTNLGYTGKIQLISRSGNLPHVHKLGYKTIESIITVQDIRENFYKTVRKFIKACRESENWRVEFDSIRQNTPQLWQALSPKYKQVFLKHFFSLWNRHRHRLPPHQFETIISLQNRGTIEIIKGNKNTFNIDINCTGFYFGEYKLFSSLIKRNIVESDDINMGIKSVDTKCQIIGCPSFGTLFETMAIPEIKVQSARTAVDFFK